MANITIALDDDLLRRARARAAERGTSVNAVIREMLRQYAGPSDAADVLEMMFGIADEAGSSLGEQGITWTRDDLHDRSHLR
jgi:plasmid stability protein